MIESRSDRNRISQMTWKEVEKRQIVSPLVIVPVGSCEQHGPALTLETDSVRAEKLALMVAERLEPLALVTPVVSVGVSEHHMGFPGTLTLNPETFINVVFELVESLVRHGWRRIFVLTGHGGNEAALGVLSTRIMREIPDLGFAWSGISPLVAEISAQHAVSTVRGHCCENETSQTMYLSPESVRVDQIEEGASSNDKLTKIAAFARSVRGVHYPLTYDRVTSNGALGDARIASEGLGRVLVEAAADRLVGFLKLFATSELAPAVAAVNQGKRINEDESMKTNQ